MPDDDKLIHLTGLASDGSEKLFNGAPMEPGIHLRWSFLPEAGFPSDGFHIYRRFYAGEFLQPQPWVVIAHLMRSIETRFGLPQSQLNGLGTGSSASFAEYYRLEAGSLWQLFRQLQSPRSSQQQAVIENRGRSRTRLRMLDLLLTASLDPYIARLLGLYYIDGSVLPGTPVDYMVTGLWERAEWPQQTCRFHDIAPHAVKAGIFEIGDATVFTPTGTSLWDGPDGPLLGLSGDTALPLELGFRRPVQEVDVELATASNAPWRISAEASGRLIADSVTVIPRGPVLRFRATERFDQLQLWPTRSGEHIRWIGYRWRSGAIADVPDLGRRLDLSRVASRIVRVNPLRDATIREPHDSIIAVLPVQVPRLETCRRAMSPPMIDDGGRVVINTTDVELICGAPSAPMHFSDVTRPVRMEVGYNRADGPEPRPGDTLTATGPLPWPTPDLLAFWRLNDERERLRVMNREVSVTKHGNWGFSMPTWGPGAVSTDRFFGREQPALELFFDRGGPAAAGPGRLEISGLPELNQLGTHLYLQLFVLPHPDSGFFPTLVGNRYQESFWLGLSRQPDGYRLRFWLNGREPVESQGKIKAGYWSQVGVGYDGESIRFFIDGKLDSVIASRRGRINPNRRGTLCLGCDPQPPGDQFAFPFRGHLADLQIWRAIYPSPFVPHPHFLAGWTLNNDLSDLKTRQRAGVVGSQRFEPDHPQHADRQVFLFDGSTLLEFRGRSDRCDPGRRLTLQVWVKPEAGQAIATLLGNDRTASYWFGLESAASSYRLSVSVNGAVHGSEDLLPANEWSHVTISLDGERIVFYINGRNAGTREAHFGRVRANSANTLCIGADAGSRLGSFRQPFRGRLADVHLWSSTPGAPSPALLADKVRSREQQLRDQANAETVTQGQSGQETSSKYENLRAAWSFEGSLCDLKTCKYAASLGTIGFERGFGDGIRRDDQRVVLVLNGSACVEVRDRPPEFYSFGNQLLLQAWIRPDRVRPVLDPREAARQDMTLISNDRESSFALVLRSHGLDAYRIWFFVNGRQFQSSGTVPAQRWSRVGVSYDAEAGKIFFYINGSRDPEAGYDARLDLIRENRLRVLRIGGEVDLDALRVNFPYRGRLADVEIWTAIPETPEEPLPDASDLLIPADYIARQMPNGAYQFWVAGIDLFGRRSAKSFNTVALNNQSPPAPPGGTRAEFIPLRGRILNLDSDARVLKVDRIKLTGIAVEKLIGYDAQIIRPRASDPNYADVQSFEITRATLEGTGVSLSVLVPPFGRLEADDIGREITIAYDQRLWVGWTWTGTQRLFAPNAREFKVYNRHAIRVQLPDETTGPSETRRPKPATKEEFVPPPMPDGQPVWDSFEAKAAPPITLVNDVIEQDSAGTPLEIKPLSHDEWQRLYDPQKDRSGNTPRAIRWLPEPEDPSLPAGKSRRPRARLFCVILPVHSALLDDRHRHPSPHRMTVEDFVPGALVAYNSAPDALAWQHFQVLWHEWSGGVGWKLFIVQTQPGRHQVEGEPAPSTPESLRPQLTSARYYPGQRYIAEVALASSPDFNPSHVGAVKPVGTVRYEISVTTLDSESRESEKGIAASVIAVNRRRPPLPPRPIVEIGRANYYGESKATVRWEITPELREASASYQLYRATDSAIFTRDLEQRRRSQDTDYNRRQPGYYTGKTEEQETPKSVAKQYTVFEDDPDFLDWLQARFPDWVGDWQRRLFVPKPADFKMPGMSAAEEAAWERSKVDWNAATEVWRAWADRFYPALRPEPTISDGQYSPSQSQQIAERPGNETAFTLVNARPLETKGDLRLVMVGGLEHAECIDALNGTVRNRYLYRLRSQNPALLQSTGWGPTSEPKTAERTRPPRAPVFTKIEAGDRSITLDWTLGNEPELAGYRVYRVLVPSSRNPSAEERARLLVQARAEIEDLRWFGTGPDPRNVGTVPDPRYKVHGRALELAGDLAVVAVLGVYRTSEFDFAANPPEAQPRALNYIDSSTTVAIATAGEGVAPPRPHLIAQLRRIPDGTAVIVVYRDRAGAVALAHERGTVPPFVDAGLIGRSDYFYRLVAFDAADKVSAGSEIKRARPLEAGRPRPPSLAVWRARRDREPDQVTVECTADEPGLALLVQRKDPADTFWRTVVEWHAIDGTMTFSEDIGRNQTFIYRAAARTAGGSVSAFSREEVVRPPIQLSI